MLSTKSINKIILLILIVGFCFNSKGQDHNADYIIRNNNDTIFGNVKMDKDQKYCIFRATTDKRFHKILPEEIKEIRLINGCYYVSKEIDMDNNDKKKKWYFIEFLVEGGMNLYYVRHRDIYFLEKEDSFIEIDGNKNKHVYANGKEYLIQDKKYLNDIKIIMKETPQLYNSIDKIEHTTNSNMINLTTNYNTLACRDTNCTVYKKKILPLTYKIESTTGLNKHNSYYSPYTGILVHISNPLRDKNLSFVGGFIYSDKIFSAKDSLFYPYLNKTAPHYSYSIKLSLRVQYTFGDKNLKPFLSAGYIWGYIPAIQGGVIYSLPKKFEINANFSVDNIITPSKEIFDNDFGHSFGIGLIYKFD